MVLGVQGQDPQGLPQHKCQKEKGKKQTDRQESSTPPPKPLLAPILFFADNIEQGILLPVLQDT